MSMHSYVEVGVEVDEKIKKFKAVEEACEQAGVEVPKDVSDFFADLEDEGRLEGNIFWKVIEEDLVKDNSRDGEGILEIDLTKLPPEVKHIRLVNSY